MQSCTCLWLVAASVLDLSLAQVDADSGRGETAPVGGWSESPQLDQGDRRCTHRPEKRTSVHLPPSYVLMFHGSQRSVLCQTEEQGYELGPLARPPSPWGMSWTSPVSSSQRKLDGCP